MKNRLLYIVAISILLFTGTTLLAQEEVEYRGKEKFKNIAELIRIVELAREAGFSEEVKKFSIKDKNERFDAKALAKESGFTRRELEKITLDYQGQKISLLEYIRMKEKNQDKTIGVKEYIEIREHARKKKGVEERNFNKDDFLTTQDIYDHLVTMEPDELRSFRDNLLEYTQ